MSHHVATATQDYKSVHLQADIDTANPHRLIQLLMHKLLANLIQARSHMESQTTNKKGELISRSISIIDCLRTSLNFDAGAKVSENLENLYDFMIRELLLSNMNNDLEQLGTVISLVSEIKDAWDQIRD
ncbi:MAG: flagellar export chaperone FliS [Pseudomonadota bacterium]